MTVVREDAVAAWRRAEARVYPTVMVDAAMYEQYLTMVRAVADELADVRTEEDLLTAWEERRELASAVVARHAPSMRAFMDLEAVRDAAFCHRHREITRARASVRLYRTFLLRELLPYAAGRYRGRRLRVPTLMLHGKRDVAVDYRRLGDWPSWADDMSVELRDDSGHFIAEEKPEFATQQALEFFAPLRGAK